MTSRGFAVSLISRIAKMGGRYWWLSFFLWIILVAPAQAASELRVAIEDGVSRVKVGSSTNAIVRDSAGKEVGELSAMNAFNAQSGGSSVTVGKWRSGSLWIEPKDNGFVWIGSRWYRGKTRLVATGKGIIAVNHVDLDQYLYSVLGAEMSPSWPIEALKAQAVAARTYALYKKATGGTDTYDVGDTTKWQVYKGVESEAQSTQEASNATAGEVMVYGGKVILAVFHSASGGHTENVEDIWTGDSLAYLRGVPDYDMGAPVYQWTKTFSAGEIGRRIGGVGAVSSMTPERTTPNGRIITMLVRGSGGSKRVSGADLRKVLELRSTLFTVSKSGGSFQLDGRGFGHGLGMSQWGAHNLAQQGTGYQQILSHYYQNATLSRME
ncbi:SpoIID/LytB domain-containing protein [Limnofasciculus baicalensis]|uniref:SpoIID/LytB domain-containing protein n=1 Tax=Limnofasciculus baicalensis BBK-W-15 TaxID=2699891 RepID=A0AAE3GPR8_9CYAN|nr:SpoIID/LytB domain-containing protein [Limnofasciculus baicalensis]MCP2727658.1 SpoIID/LytB domain-containing protein [Limnofasciculus baicalensis BBK-W-15]